MMGRIVLLFVLLLVLCGGNSSAGRLDLVLAIANPVDPNYKDEPPFYFSNGEFITIEKKKRNYVPLFGVGYDGFGNAPNDFMAFSLDTVEYPDFRPIVIYRNFIEGENTPTFVVYEFTMHEKGKEFMRARLNILIPFLEYGLGKKQAIIRMPKEFIHRKTNESFDLYLDHAKLQPSPFPHRLRVFMKFGSFWVACGGMEYRPIPIYKFTGSHSTIMDFVYITPRRGAYFCGGSPIDSGHGNLSLYLDCTMERGRYDALFLQKKIAAYQLENYIPFNSLDSEFGTMLFVSAKLFGNEKVHSYKTSDMFSEVLQNSEMKKSNHHHTSKSQRSSSRDRSSSMAGNDKRVLRSEVSGSKRSVTETKSVAHTAKTRTVRVVDRVGCGNGTFFLEGLKLPLFTLSYNGMQYSDAPDNFETYYFYVSKFRNFEGFTFSEIHGECCVPSRIPKYCDTAKVAPKITDFLSLQLEKYDQSLYPLLQDSHGTKKGVLRAQKNFFTQQADTLDFSVDYFQLEPHLRPDSIELSLVGNEVWVKPHNDVEYRPVNKLKVVYNDNKGDAFLYITQQYGAYECEAPGKSITFGKLTVRKMVCVIRKKYYAGGLQSLITKHFGGEQISSKGNVHWNMRNGAVVFICTKYCNVGSDVLRDFEASEFEKDLRERWPSS